MLGLRRVVAGPPRESRRVKPFDPTDYITWRTIPHLIAVGAWGLAWRGFKRLIAA